MWLGLRANGQKRVFYNFIFRQSLFFHVFSFPHSRTYQHYSCSGRGSRWLTTTQAAMKDKLVSDRLWIGVDGTCSVLSGNARGRVSVWFQNVGRDGIM